MFELTGIDADIFLENLSKELTKDERREVREWVLGDT